MASIVQQVQLVSHLLEFLPAKQPGANKERLIAWLSHSDLGISFRQLQRYLCELEAVGWASRAKQGKEDFWIRVHRGTRVTELSRERAFALQLIQHKLQHLVPPQILEALSEEFKLASDKLRQHYPNERAWMGKIAEAPPLLRSAPIRTHVFPVLTEALLEDKLLKIIYHNRVDQEARERIIMPLGIVSRESLYYLVARYPSESLNRQFRIDRIHIATMLEDVFIPPSEFSLADCLDEGFFNYANGNNIQLVFKMKKSAAFHLKETPLSSDQEVLDLDDEWCRVSCTTQESSKLKWWLLGLGSSVKVESPNIIARCIENEIKLSLSNYSK